MAVEISGDRVEVAAPTSYELGEGAIYDAERGEYLHVDILGRTVSRHNLATGALTTYAMPTPVGTIVPLARGGGALVALKDGPAVLDYTTGAVTPVGPPLEHHVTTCPLNRCNDGKAGPDGRFYFGTMHSPSVDPRPRDGKLYVLDHDLAPPRVLLEAVTISNGIAWAPDGRTMYYIDTPTMEVAAFDFDADKGAISNRRVAFRVPPGTGSPDGCTMDAEGKLWVAQWGGSRVVRYDPATGDVLATVRLPTAHVSSVAFGGPDLDEIYITTAKEFMDEAQRAREPLAGHVFVVRNSGFRGLPACAFRG
jgi:sugar lactone lactonase YvrE